LVQLRHGFDSELGVLRESACLEWSFVELVLVFESVHSNSLLNFFHEVSNYFANSFVVISNTHDVLALSHQHVKFLIVVGVVVWHSTHLRELTNSLKELIGGACHLWLEVSEPEDLSVFRVGQDRANLPFKIGVNDVFHINRFKIISPRVQDLETLVRNVLISISLNVFLQELESSLVSLYWVSEIVSIDFLGLFSQE
tara:strand:- start:608 stop:1201 length:594 start_codon:yes stop_codon:yes gene_type:complete